MNGVDPNNIFALIAAAMATADAINQDARQSLDNRAAAGRLRDGLRSWKGLAFSYRDWTPAAPSASATNGVSSQ
ncbi:MULTISPECIES: hypothetical protein [Burkholderia cepacia complex]|uniref:hypothetical protein n=1 Tax=Burkholderia cepacia complex TaxID=87882 RepID=UPI0007575625|nr:MULTISPECIES: hypothetical protein [Burkholderia cepacia complex]KVR94063.1 hypothetical protein WK28_14370 [Burkholderia vietnamiensis]RQU56488.1 hypothetical protein DF143_23645 [Burkholderia cenocepacia]RQV39408.1 hypothetical protein DF033_24025 [Burkholderia cenocepacia]